MKLGVSTLCLFRKPFRDVVKEIDARSEVKVWEIVDEGLHRLDSERIRKLKEFKVEYTIHAPFSDLNTASLTSEFKKLTFKVLEKSIYHAYRLSSSVWVMHAGVHSPLGYFHPDEEWKTNVDVVRHLAEEAGRYGVRIAIENLAGRGILKSEEEILRFLEEVNTENISICVDIGHLNIVKEGNLLDSLRKLRGKTVALHIHDNDGEKDRHWMVGAGRIDWRKILSFLVETKFEGYGIMENYTVRESIESLRRINRFLKEVTALRE